MLVYTASLSLHTTTCLHVLLTGVSLPRPGLTSKTHTHSPYFLLHLCFILHCTGLEVYCICVYWQRLYGARVQAANRGITNLLLQLLILST
jgi:hypothetical protein